MCVCPLYGCSWTLTVVCRGMGSEWAATMATTFGVTWREAYSALLICEGDLDRAGGYILDARCALLARSTSDDEPIENEGNSAGTISASSRVIVLDDDDPVLSTDRADRSTCAFFCCLASPSRAL